MQFDDIERKIEAILFASGSSIECEKIASALDTNQQTVINLIQNIRERYLAQKSPFDIIYLSGSYQMCTLPQYANVIRTALTLRKGSPLSQASLEVLAVIAYNQPVTRGFVEQVRGVDCASIVRSLTDKGLVEEAGRLQIPGKPISYKTTTNFLRCFGISDISQLPTVLDVNVEKDDKKHLPLDGQTYLYEVTT